MASGLRESTTTTTFPVTVNPRKSIADMKSLKGGIMGTVSLILIAGALVLMFFVVLSGVTGTTPLNKTYFLQADTSSIPGARAISQWTYFYVCGEGNTDCGSPVPDLPFGYAWVGNSAGVPAGLVGYVL
jgi:hypothetical protein